MKEKNELKHKKEESLQFSYWGLGVLLSNFDNKPLVFLNNNNELPL